MSLTSGALVWITGMSGAGKSTVAAELVDRLHRRGVRPVLLDGDQLRAALGIAGTFDHQGRHNLAFVYARLCRLLAGQGQIVICSTIALFHDVQAWNRANIDNYLEVFLDVPVDELRARDTKGLYASDGQQMVGVHVPAEFPLHPDLAVRNFGETLPGDVAETIIRFGTTKGVW
nr:adenylyl-sulfate kinase [uncultured Actinoplanes sp.]